MDITQIYSGAVYFGVPMQAYWAAYVLVMIMFLAPTLIAMAWALTIGQRNRAAIRLVRPSERVEERVELTGLERDRDQRTDRAA